MSCNLNRFFFPCVFNNKYINPENEKNADAIQKFGAKAKMLIHPKIKAQIF